MPSGFSTGNVRIVYQGLPFRVRANSAQEAEAILDAALSKDEAGLMAARAQELGLSAKDVANLKAVDAAGGDSSVLAGQVDAEAAAPTSPIGKGFAGAGRTIVGWGRGLHQIYADVMGDEEASRLLSEVQKNEDETWDQFDRLTKGGAEDVGEIAPYLAAFLLPGTQSYAGAATVSGLLATADVQENATAADRLMSFGKGAALGALGTGAGQALGWAGGLFGRILAASRVGTRLGQGAGFITTKLRPLFGRSAPAGTEQPVSDMARGVIKEALDALNQPKPTPGYDYLARKGLDYVAQAIRTLPATESRGLLNETVLAGARKALATAAEASDDGVLLNAPVFKQSLLAIEGQIGSAFRQTVHTQTLGAIRRFADALVDTSDNVTLDSAKNVVGYLVSNPVRAKAVEEAFRLAKTPEVKQELSRGLVQQATEWLQTIGRGETVGGAVTPAAAAATAAGTELLPGTQQIRDF
jgi:hypothetical protein